MAIIHRLVVLFALGEKVLLKKVGGTLTLPSTEDDEIKKGSRYFAYIYGQTPQIEAIYPDVYFKSKGQTILLHAFRAPIPSDNMPEGDYELVDYDGFEKKHYDPLTYSALCRHFYFLPLTEGSTRSIPLEAEAKRQAEDNLACLKHFHRRVPKAERKAYADLIDTIASPTRLNKAFLYLAMTYGLDLEKYEEFAANRKALKESLE